MPELHASSYDPDILGIDRPEPIAIVGIGCRLPGDVSSASACWEFLQSGKNARCGFPKSRFNIDAFYSSRKGTPGTLPMKGGYFLDQDIRHFDNGFFGINNLEATYMDPQQRNLLEVVYECFESAGIRLEDLPSSNVGCYVGDFVYDFLVMQAKDDESFHRYSPTGKGRTILSNRISHAFDLHGPSLTLDTACSSSLYCLHVACRALLQKDCDAAIVAAANLVQTPEQQMDVAASGVLSSTSTCHTFDAAADGYGRADAIGALYLKRLSDAIRDNDPIRSVIRATSTNSNGQTSGITMPSADYQEAVIKKAYEFAKLGIVDTDYFECHGTGTPVGDPIEVSAVANARSRIARLEVGPKLIIGSTKPSFGHSEAASGITSIIKTTLALENLQIPPTVGISKLNPKIPWLEHNLEVARSLVCWPQAANQHIPRASINSFGYGGANAHCILDNAQAWIDRLQIEVQAPRTTHSHADDQAFLLPFSARDADGLRRRMQAFADIDLTESKLADLAFTLATRRTAFQYRNFVVCHQSSWSSAFTSMDDESSVHLTDASVLPLAFVFTGQGSQWPRMGRRLFEAYTPFRNSILALEYHLFSLPNSPTWSLSAAVFHESGDNIHQPYISQTVCTAIQIALVDLLRVWGIRPQFVVGHSSGEIAAAYTAGHISASYAIETAYLRGQAVNANSSNDDGAMMAVAMAPDEAQRLIEDHDLQHLICVACHNSPESVTISGNRNAINDFQKLLQDAGKVARILNTGGQAYHSHHMRQIGYLYETSMADARHRELHQSSFFHKAHAETLNGASVQMISTALGRWVTSADTSDPAYWRNNLESPVLFSDAIEVLTKDRRVNFVEIGPHHTMRMPVHQTGLLTQNPGAKPLYLSALVRHACSEKTALNLSGTLWTHGYEIDFEAIRQSYRWNDKTKPKVLHNLPNYPWDHSKLLWNEPRSSVEYRNRRFPRDELIGSRLPSSNGKSVTWRGLLDVANVPWLLDHKIGDKIVLPGACYISMAVRACQQLFPESLNPTVLEMRDVKIEKVMVLKPESRVEIITELRPHKLSNVQDSTCTWEFTIFSINEARSVRHAGGCIEAICPSTLVPIADIPTRSILEQQSKRLWYSQFMSKGLAFGPAFESLSSIFVPRQRHTMSAEACLETLSEKVLNEYGHLYPFDVHPIVTDAAFQTGLVATASGDLEQLIGQVPTSIDCLHLFRNSSCPKYSEFRTRATAKVTGPGSAVGRCEVMDSAGQKVLQIHNVKVTRLQDTDILSIPRTPILKTVWVPDLSSIGDHNVDTLMAKVSTFHARESLTSHPDIAAILALKAMISPELSVLQVGHPDETMSDVLSMLEQHTSSSFKSFTFGLPQESGEMLCLDIKDRVVPDVADFSTHGWRLSKTTNQYDVVVLQSGLDNGDISVLLAKNVEKHIKSGGFILALKNVLIDHGSDSGIFMDDLSSGSEKDPKESSNFFSNDINFNCVDLAPIGEGEYLSLITIANGQIDSSKVPMTMIVSDVDHPLNKALLQRLQGSDLQISLLTLDDLEADTIQPQSIVLVTVELEDAIAANATQDQLSKIQTIANTAAKVIWMTGSGPSSSTSPEHRTILGLSRSIMAGNPSIRFIVLDIDNPRTRVVSTCANVEVILDSISNSSMDLEYLQKDGLLFISRLLPADSFNATFEQKKQGTASLAELSSLGSCELHIRDPGQFDTLEFCSIELEPNLPPDYVEVAVKAVGMNAKDLYTLSGKVDTVENTCSCEFSGIIKAIGSAVTGFSIGDRIVSSAPGRYRPTERVPASVCYKMHDDEDFTEMASVPMVYGTAIHALRNLANLQCGESVLIHSAAGGVGTAAILLAKQIGADIYVTVGNDKKKEYLVDQYGLNPDHVFHSRDTSFLPAILKATGGRGVDVVLNSLTDARLHASLVACAQFGRFIEIGKRDILDSGNLNMNVFSRGITFSAFDLHELFYSKNARHRHIYEKLLIDAVEFYRTLGYTANATTSFDVSDIGSAFRYFANSSRIGKVAITFDNPASVVSFVPPKFSTRFSADKSYLLVGCLGGLGRSISRYMLHNGARHFTFLGRSGTTKPAAAALVADLEQSGASVTVIAGDVCSMSDVERAVSALHLPLGGVIQAAMGLSEALFPAMTHSAWHTALDPKIRGTWNLHHAIASHEHSLDFFLLTSSVSGTIGFSTESNYCAANCFLDHFATFRRQQGLKATSVALGPVSGAGIVHENPEIENVFFRGGITDISEDDMLCIIDIALSNQTDSASAHLLTGLEPAKAKAGFEQSWQMLAPDPRLTHITASYRAARAAADQSSSSSTHANGTNHNGKPIDPRLRAALDKMNPQSPPPKDTSDSTSTTTNAPPAATLDTTLHTIVAEQLSKLVLMEPDKIAASMYLSDVGMDSTLAAQLRTCVFRATGVDVSYVLLMDVKSRVADLVAAVKEGLVGGGENEKKDG